MANQPSKEKARPKRPTAAKRELQNAKRRVINKTFKSKVKSASRRFEQAMSSKDVMMTTTKLSELHSLLDKAVKRGIFKLNKASRLKSRSTARLHLLSA